MPRAGFKPVQNLSSGFVESICALVIATTPRHHVKMQRMKEKAKGRGNAYHQGIHQDGGRGVYQKAKKKKTEGLCKGFKNIE